ncbi:MAG TPA: hypothetical protein VJ813_21490 [Vicinamibacterales bacterium]|nr:hypothetical protein [Vicinamibacterales bacterium]
MATATEMMARARRQALAASLASARMEQLRSLRFEFDESGGRLTDTATDLTIDPAGSGGPGLSPSGAGALDANLSGFVDYLDGRGSWVGAGPAAPPGAAFVRRWSVEPADAGSDLLVLQVLVRPVVAGSAGAVGRLDGGARYVTLRARTRR